MRGDYAATPAAALVVDKPAQIIGRWVQRIQNGLMDIRPAMRFAFELEELANLLETLYATSACLRFISPDRKFTLARRLSDLPCEVLAVYMLDLILARGSTQCHDCTWSRRQASTAPRHLGIAARGPARLVFLHSPKNGRLRFAYNGPVAVVWVAAGTKRKNGQQPMTHSKLAKLDHGGVVADRLPQNR